jgi:hypothetical protein
MIAARPSRYLSRSAYQTCQPITVALPAKVCLARMGFVRWVQLDDSSVWWAWQQVLPPSLLHRDVRLPWMRVPQVGLSLQVLLLLAARVQRPLRVLPLELRRLRDAAW